MAGDSRQGCWTSARRAAAGKLPRADVPVGVEDLHAPSHAGILRAVHEIPILHESNAAQLTAEGTARSVNRDGVGRLLLGDRLPHVAGLLLRVPIWPGQIVRTLQVLLRASIFLKRLKEWPRVGIAGMRRLLGIDLDLWVAVVVIHRGAREEGEQLPQVLLSLQVLSTIEER